MRVPWQLRLVWAEIPNVGCKGRCAESCGEIVASPIERAILADRGIYIEGLESAALVLAANIHDEGRRCPALVDGRCSVYEIRPAICRLWGSIARVEPCPHGCRAPGPRWTDDRMMDLLARLEAMPVPVTIRKAGS